MKLKPIKSEQDYEVALDRLELIFDTLPRTEDSDELEILGMLIEKYEKNIILWIYQIQLKARIIFRDDPHVHQKIAYSFRRV